MIKFEGKFSYNVGFLMDFKNFVLIQQPILALQFLRLAFAKAFVKFDPIICHYSSDSMVDLCLSSFISQHVSFKVWNSELILLIYFLRGVCVG